MVNAQEWLNKKYPKELRKEITSLNINEQNLEGSLSLEGFTNLKLLDCHNNFLTSLDLSESTNLEVLDVMDNDFPFQDLSFLSHLFNLKGLGLGNLNKEKIRQNIYNRFYGSLKPLRNMTRLNILNISNTDLDSGLEYLPDDIEQCFCSTDLRKNARVKNIADLLASKKEEAKKRESSSNALPKPQANQEKFELFRNTDNLQSVQNNVQEFFTKWNGFLSHQAKLANIKKQIAYCNYVKRISFCGGLIGIGLSTQYNYPGAALAITACIGERTSGWKKKRLQKREKELQEEIKQGNGFLQATENLKDTYQELLETFKELSLLSYAPTESEKVNNSFNFFLKAISNLKNWYSADDFAAEQGMTEEVAIQFALELQDNWMNYRLGEIVNNFIWETNDYRQQLYQKLTSEQKTAQIQQNYPPK